MQLLFLFIKKIIFLKVKVFVYFSFLYLYFSIFQHEKKEQIRPKSNKQPIHCANIREFTSLVRLL